MDSLEVEEVAGEGKGDRVGMAGYCTWGGAYYTKLGIGRQNAQPAHTYNTFSASSSGGVRLAVVAGPAGDVQGGEVLAAGSSPVVPPPPWELGPVPTPAGYPPGA